MVQSGPYRSLFSDASRGSRGDAARGAPARIRGWFFENAKRGGRETRVCGGVIGQRIAQRWRFVFLERRAARGRAIRDDPSVRNGRAPKTRDVAVCAPAGARATPGGTRGGAGRARDAFVMTRARRYLVRCLRAPRRPARSPRARACRSNRPSTLPRRQRHTPTSANRGGEARRTSSLLQ